MENNIYNLDDYYKALKLQEDYEKGVIDEDEISLEEYDELIKLYKIQIRKLADDINYRIKLLQRGDK